MNISQKYLCLQIAEDIAIKHGDDNMFRQVYTMRREENDILDSVEYTMMYLGHYHEWYSEYMAACAAEE